MKKRNLPLKRGLLAFSALLTLTGCHAQASEAPAPSFTSIPPSSSSVSSQTASEPSASPEAPASQYALEDVSFLDDPQNPGSLAVSYPNGMFTGKPVWMDSTHIYLEPKGNTGFGVIVDIGNRTFTQAPAFEHKAGLSYASCQDDAVYLVFDDNSIQKRDRSFNLLSSVSFGEEADNDVCTIHPALETLYYIRQDDPEKPVLCRKKDGKTETVTVLPPLGDKEYYYGLQISPSGGKLLFYKIYYEMLAKYIYVYDMNTNTLEDITHHYEGSTASGFWLPSGMWMGEQPVVLLHHEYDYSKASNEIRYGIPPESKAEIFYNPLNDKEGVYNPSNDLSCSLLNDEISPLSCITFTAGQQDFQQEGILYFRDNGTYLSYLPEKDFSVYYPQLSPDYGWLSFTPSLGGQDDYTQIRLIPTEALWKPLDWKQVQAELDGIVSGVSARE